MTPPGPPRPRPVLRLVPLLLTTTVLALLLVPLPASTRFSASLHPIAHGVLGALLGATFAAHLGQRCPSRPGAWIALWSLVLVGVVLGLGEVLQPLAGRTRSVGDLAVGLAGAVAGVALWAARSKPRGQRAALGGLGVVILLLPWLHAGVTAYDIRRQERAFPLLASFADRIELLRWRANDADYELSRRHVTHGETSLQVDLHPAGFPGVSMAWPPRDWRAHNALALDLWLGGDLPLDLLLKVEDHDHGGEAAFRSLHPLRLEPGPNALRIPLEAIRTGARGGPIDLGRVAGFTILAVDLQAAQRFWLDDVRLEPLPPGRTDDGPAPE